MIKFKSGLQKILIEVPDEILEEPTPTLDPLLQSVNEMLGKDYQYQPSGQSDKALLEDALQEKYR